MRDDDIRRDAGRAGGATLDLGVYCINAARNLFAAEPESVVAEMIERDGTDDTVTATLRFPKNRLAQFCISNSVAGVSSYRIAGTEGDLRVEPAYEYVGALVHYLTIADETKRKEFQKGDQFAPELKYFSECILTGREPEPLARRVGATSASPRPSSNQRESIAPSHSNRTSGSAAHRSPRPTTNAP